MFFLTERLSGCIIQFDGHAAIGKTPSGHAYPEQQDLPRLVVSRSTTVGSVSYLSRLLGHVKLRGTVQQQRTKDKSDAQPHQIFFTSTHSLDSW